MQIPMVSHDKGGYVAPHVDYLDLRNSVAPFMTSLESHDFNASAKVSHGKKVMLHVISFVLN